jgi:hypothetical protein
VVEGAEALVRAWFANPWGQLTNLLVALAVGVVVARFYFQRSLLGPQLSYHWTNRRLLGSVGQDLPDSVEVRFLGQGIKRLNRATYLLWNSGNRTLPSANAVVSDPFRIEPPEGGRLLSSSILKQTRSVIAPSMHFSDNNAILITFDYFDPMDGIILEVLFEPGSVTNGEKSSLSAPTLVGTFREMPAGIKNLGDRSLPMKLSTILPVTGLGVVMSLFGVAGLSDAIRKGATFGSIAAMLFGFGICLFVAIALWQSRRRYPKELRVAEFEQ